MTIGRGKPTKAISQRIAPNEKNQNSSPAQSRWVTVARAKTVKNVWLRIAQSGRRKIATTNFTQRVGIIHASPARWRCAGGAYDAILRRRGRLRPWCKVDFRFFAAKLSGDYADGHGKSPSSLLLMILILLMIFQPGDDQDYDQDHDQDHEQDNQQDTAAFCALYNPGGRCSVIAQSGCHPDPPATTARRPPFSPTPTSDLSKGAQKKKDRHKFAV